MNGEGTGGGEEEEEMEVRERSHAILDLSVPDPLADFVPQQLRKDTRSTINKKVWKAHITLTSKEISFS